MKEFVLVMKALSDINRLKIVKMLQHRPMMCVCEIRAALGIAQPTVSKHLRRLEDSGVVKRKKSGLWVNFYLSDGAENAYVASILGNLRHWLENDPEIVGVLDDLGGIHREELCGG